MTAVQNPAETAGNPVSLSSRYRAVRDLTEQLATPLSPEDQCVQSMPDVSPTKWHRAHVTWFFETFLLQPHEPGYAPLHERYAYLFNSYYEAVGPRHPRPERGLIVRPDNAQITEYRLRVDEAMVGFIDAVAADRPDLIELIELGLHHEQQHQELILMDIKHVLSLNDFAPAYRERAAEPQASPSPHRWVDHPGGIVDIGHRGRDFRFDNEGPRHSALLQPHRLADRLVTNGEWLEFIADGGYHRADLWLSAGWLTIKQQDWDAPLYWQRGADGWEIHTLNGVHLVDPSQPVVHVSYFEADAFARWAGARLPTEFEWENAAARVEAIGNLLPSEELHPLPASDPATGFQQLYGDVWEWTASAYAPYPGFRAAPGAVGEYNGKFMVDQQVLRGGACVTPGDHVRSSYRNFFPTHSRWMFSGLRLADDGSRQ